MLNGEKGQCRRRGAKEHTTPPQSRGKPNTSTNYLITVYYLHPAHNPQRIPPNLLADGTAGTRQPPDVGGEARPQHRRWRHVMAPPRPLARFHAPLTHPSRKPHHDISLPGPGHVPGFDFV